MVQISIHAPRVGRDVKNGVLDARIAISIHAPRVGRDSAVARSLSANAISIHAPRVGRDKHSPSGGGCREAFQSTRPVWGATSLSTGTSARVGISIHAPRVGRDGSRRACRHRRHHFNPRAPCGARPVAASLMVRFGLFQSTRPVWGATNSIQEELQ